jgi:hypothetical protein
MRPYTYTFLGLWIAAKFAFKALVYFPYLVTAWIFSSFLLHRKDHGLIWLVLTLLFVWLIHLLFTRLKRLVNYWRAKNFIYWIPLFIFCVAYACVYPVYLVFGPLEHFIAKMTHESNVSLITWILSLSFGLFIFLRHRFLKN